MNRGGRGHKTENKHCYACCSKRDKASFSTTQWEMAEEKKSRRCMQCIKDGIMVGALMPGQTDLFGNVIRPHLPKTPTPAASDSSPPAEPPAAEPPLAAAVVIADAQAAAPTAAAPPPAEPPRAAAAPPPSEPPLAAAAPPPAEPPQAAPAAPAAVSFTSSPSRRSARAGGAYGATAIAERRSPAYGATAIAERRSPSKAPADTELKALKAELAATVAELEKYKSEREQSAAMAARAAAAAVDASVMQAQVDAHLAKLIAKRIADAATHNTSHSIGTPHMAAAIRATFAHARARATSPPLSPSRQLVTLVFEAPKALDIDEYMLQMGAKHSILDWREFGQHAFWCSTCKEMSMCVAKTDRDPDGQVRDKYSCTANGALGLCKLSGGDAPWTLASPKLVCTSPCCRHEDCMHSEAVLQHIPPKLLGHYPCDLPWIKGVQEHVVRSFTTRIESLYVPPTDDL
jgi:hypothetical protein